MNKVFAYHKPSPEGLVKVARLREAFSTLLAELDATCPASREKAVAVTNLETAAMWAVKSVVANDPASEVCP